MANHSLIGSNSNFKLISNRPARAILKYDTLIVLWSDFPRENSRDYTNT